jgi:hypothetical protein
MSVMVNLLAIHIEATPEPAHMKEEIPILKAECSMDTKMDNMMKAIEAWTFQTGTPNEPGYRGYPTARAYAIKADHPYQQIPMEPNYQSYPQQD